MRKVEGPGMPALMLLLALVLVPILDGCDGTPPASSSTERARVKGVLTLGGKPLGKVEVRFNAANINRKAAPTATATTGEDGSYEVTTLVGENAISLGGSAVGESTRQLAYFNKSFDVQAGENTLDLAVP